MNILICDDHLLFREGLCRLLVQMDDKARFLEAGTFTEMLELTRTDQPFDLILMDLQMPGFPGFSGVREICRLQAGKPVVIISASESPADVRAALDAGVAGYIPKSSSVKLMLGALNLVFSGGVYVPPIALNRQQGQPVGHAHGVRPNDASHGEQDSEDVVGHIGLPKIDPLAAGSLTQRQRDVLRCLKEGKSNREIAVDLGLSEGTVKIHVTGLMRNLGVRNRTQAVIAAHDVLS
jgi:DNA-binding NarL/FixJ family response regulator